MSVEELYRETVLEHHRAPRRRGALPGWTHAADGANPLCGDRVRFELVLRDGTIVDLRHSGEACAITTATASIVAEWAVGHDGAAVAALRSRFAAFLAGTDASAAALEPVALGALAELRQHPARRPCALLPLEALLAALRGEARASTETDAPPQDRQHA